ncbi:anaphase-promoting complex subunit Hcn1 [Geranomyces michiganensis]|nr:anaphase-promoting complex subunit Hcn1 [Geranomyces michiganensis]
MSLPLLDTVLGESVELFSASLKALDELEQQSNDLLLQLQSVKLPRDARGRPPSSNTSEIPWPSPHLLSETGPIGTVSRSSIMKEHQGGVGHEDLRASSFVLPTSIFASDDGHVHKSQADSLAGNVQPSPAGHTKAEEGRPMVPPPHLHNSPPASANPSLLRAKAPVLSLPMRIYQMCGAGIDPRNPWKQRWDAYMSLTYWYAAIMFPIVLSFEKAAHEMPSGSLSSFYTAVWALDTIISLFTLRLQPRATKPDTLAQSIRYRLTTLTFYIDLMTIPPYENILPLPDISTVNPHLYTFVRIFRVPPHLFEIVGASPLYARFGRALSKALNVGSSHARMGVFLGWLLFYLHSNACLTFLIGQLSSYTQVSWKSADWVVSQSLFVQYSWSVLMAVANSWPFTTDIQPHDPFEAWGHTIFVVFGALMTGTVTGFIQASRVELDPSGREYKELVGQASEYLENKGTDPRIRVKVRHFLWLKFRGKCFDEGILEDMNPCLREQIAEASCHAMLKSVSFLNHPDERIRGKLAVTLKEDFYTPGDTVYTVGSRDASMYLIGSGAVELLGSKGERTIRTTGDHFGEYALLDDVPRWYTVKVISACHLYVLHRKDYLEVVHVFCVVGEYKFSMSLPAVSSRADSQTLHALLANSDCGLVDVNQPDSVSGRTLLHAATAASSLECVEILLAQARRRKCAVA